jgi:hypothetical protein
VVLQQQPPEKLQRRSKPKHKRATSPVPSHIERSTEQSYSFIRHPRKNSFYSRLAAVLFVVIRDLLPNFPTLQPMLYDNPDPVDVNRPLLSEVCRTVVPFCISYSLLALSSLLPQSKRCSLMLQILFNQFCQNFHSVLRVLLQSPSPRGAPRPSFAFWRRKWKYGPVSMARRTSRNPMRHGRCVLQDTVGKKRPNLATSAP